MVRMLFPAFVWFLPPTLGYQPSVTEVAYGEGMKTEPPSDYFALLEMHSKISLT